MAVIGCNSATAPLERRPELTLVQRMPAGRLGRPDDLVGAVMLLCSDAGSYINGIDLFVEGGRTAV